MSNHARGLWGYSGRTAAGDELTIQSTGMGGPSAALVLADLAKLGVRRAVRVGTCAAVGGRAKLGELLLPRETVAGGGSSASFGLDTGAVVAADGDLLERLEKALGDAAREALVASLDTIHPAGELPADAEAADMQTAAVLARADSLGVTAAAILIVNEAEEELLSDDELELCAKRAGRAAAQGLA
jgi:uridine phosphorylase